MKTINQNKTFKLTGISMIIMLLFACNKDDNQPIVALYTQNDANKMAVQTIATNVGVGFNDVFKTWNTDSLNRTEFCQDFTHAARFMDDSSGYVFVETLNGYNIAHPTNPALEGTSTIGQTDANGKLIVEDMISIVQHIGFGFLEYDYLNPATQQIDMKTTFVKSIPEASWYTGSGFYNETSTSLLNLKEVNSYTVKQSVIAMAKGLGAVLPKHTTDSLQSVELMRTFLQHIRFFDDQSGYYYVIDFKGYNVVQPPDPSIQGTDEWDIQDSQGNYLVQGLIETAKNGGGYYSYYWRDYQSNEEKLKTAYVEQIPGKDYLIGSGIYVSN